MSVKRIGNVVVTHGVPTIRYDTIYYINVYSKADVSQLNVFTYCAEFEIRNSEIRDTAKTIMDMLRRYDKQQICREEISQS